MDSNVENILRNMVDGTTEYDPPHSRVEKLLIELKEALDAGGGGGTVDDVARNRINTHIDNSNVHVSTAEKSSWNDKVERSDLTAHTEDTAIHVTNNDKVTWNGKAEQQDLSEHADNGEIHVTAEEKAAWNGKAELSDIPSTLPANGGNADTVNGKHANEFMQFLGDVRNGSLLDYILSLDRSGFLYCGSANCTDMPVDGTYFMVEVRCYTTVKEVKATSFSTGAVYTNRYSGSKWSGWTNVANGGNADTLDGLHANEIASNPNLLINPDFSVNQRGITSASGGTSSVYIADGWYSQRAIISRPENGGISIAWDGTNKDNGWVQQKIETAALFGKTVTISADIDGKRKSVTTTVPTLVNKTDGSWVDSNEQVMFAVSNLGGTLMSVAIFSYTTTPIAVSNVKLELGANATRYYPPDPATELLKCQRYYQRIAAYLPSRAAGISTDFIDFVYNLSVPMMSKPSVDLSALDVYSVDYSKQTGFNSSINIVSNNSINIRATKTGHGLTDAIARPSAVLELSAEL